MLAAPVGSVFAGMGNQILIISFVVVVIGGIGSVKGALLGSLLIGLADTFGQVLAPEIAGMTVYMLMAAVLLWRPAGPFWGAPQMRQAGPRILLLPGRVAPVPLSPPAPRL